MSDQYYSVYRVMAVEVHTSKDRLGRRAFTPGEVDAMDLSTVAVMLGVDRDGNVDGGGKADEKAKMQEMARRRKAGERVNWTDL